MAKIKATEDNFYPGFSLFYSLIPESARMKKAPDVFDRPLRRICLVLAIGILGMAATMLLTLPFFLCSGEKQGCRLSDLLRRWNFYCGRSDVALDRFTKAKVESIGWRSVTYMRRNGDNKQNGAGPKC